MKQGLNLTLPVMIGMELDLIESIDFLFVQGSVKKTFTYPSATTKRREGSNIVELKWSESDTWLFNASTVDMDTKIHLKNSIENPQTEITSFIMRNTLFERSDADD